MKSNVDMFWSLYKYLHLVENTFAQLKKYHAVTTRYDKLKRNHESMYSSHGLWIFVITHVKCQQALVTAIIFFLSDEGMSLQSS